jgi:hypothetical protein
MNKEHKNQTCSNRHELLRGVMPLGGMTMLRVDTVQQQVHAVQSATISDGRFGTNAVVDQCGERRLLPSMATMLTKPLQAPAVLRASELLYTFQQGRQPRLVVLMAKLHGEGLTVRECCVQQLSPFYASA